MYYIYHIPDYVWPNGSIGKIGVSEDVPRRMKQHKWTGFYETLEQHDCIYKVSDREQELQRQYGYPVDNKKYWQMRKMSTEEGCRKGGLTSTSNHTPEHYIKMGQASGVARRRFTDIEVEYIRAQYKRGTDVFGNPISQSRLAKVFGVHRSSISDIIHYRSYK